MSVAAKRGFGRRCVGAALFQPGVYEEVEADGRANAQAAVVVALSAVAAGLGSIANHGAAGVLWYTGAALASWYVWAAIAFWIGTRLLPVPSTEADHGQLLRTVGFSSAPGSARALALPPGALADLSERRAWIAVRLNRAPPRSRPADPSSARCRSRCAPAHR